MKQATFDHVMELKKPDATELVLGLRSGNEVRGESQAEAGDEVIVLRAKDGQVTMVEVAEVEYVQVQGMQQPPGQQKPKPTPSRGGGKP